MNRAHLKSGHTYAALSLRNQRNTLAVGVPVRVLSIGHWTYAPKGNLYALPYIFTTPFGEQISLDRIIPTSRTTQVVLVERMKIDRETQHPVGTGVYTLVPSQWIAGEWNEWRESRIVEREARRRLSDDLENLHRSRATQIA